MIRRRVLSLYAREHIKILSSNGASVSEISVALDKDEVVTCHLTVWHSIQHVKSCGSIHPLPKVEDVYPVLTNEVLNIIDLAMQADDETTANSCAQNSMMLGF